MKGYRMIAGQLREALQPAEIQSREPGPGEVKVRVHAVSLNFRDVMIARGHYPLSGDRPPIALADGAGEVIAIGQQVRHVKEGDRVTSLYFPDWVDGDPTPEKLERVPGASQDGWLAEEVIVPESYVIEFPPHLTYIQAATLPCAGVTAWNALFVQGNVQPGNTVLLLGTGGVSIHALQFAKAAGLRALITSSSDQKLSRAQKLGADQIINYKRTSEWQEEVLRLTAGRGADVVLEVGGSETLNRSVAAVRSAGVVSVIGGLSGMGASLQIIPLLLGYKRLAGIAVGSRRMFESMNRLIEASRIEPVVDRVFAFGQAREAYAYLEDGAHFGKVVIDVSGHADR